MCFVFCKFPGLSGFYRGGPIMCAVFCKFPGLSGFERREDAEVGLGSVDTVHHRLYYPVRPGHMV